MTAHAQQADLGLRVTGPSRVAVEAFRDRRRRKNAPPRPAWLGVGPSRPVDMEEQRRRQREREASEDAAKAWQRERENAEFDAPDIRAVLRFLNVSECPNVDHHRIFNIDQETGERRKNRCKMWKCPYCGPIQAAILRRKISEYGQLDADMNRFFTGTLGGEDRGLPLEMRWAKLSAVWKRFLRAVRDEVGHIEYIRVYEPHKDGTPHAHALFNRYVHKSTLSRLWREAGGGKHGTRIEKVRGDIGAYMAKYLSKAVGRYPKGVRRVAFSRGTGIKMNDPVDSGRYLLATTKSDYGRPLNDEGWRYVQGDEQQAILTEHVHQPRFTTDRDWLVERLLKFQGYDTHD